jgi:hypothetical protein
MVFSLLTFYRILGAGTLRNPPAMTKAEDDTPGFEVLRVRINTHYGKVTYLS